MSTIFVCDKNFLIVWASDSLCELLDCGEEPVLGRSVLSVLKIEFGSEWGIKLLQVSPKTPPLTLSANLPNPNGEYRDFLFVFEAVPPDHDAPLGLSYVCVGMHVAENAATRVPSRSPPLNRIPEQNGLPDDPLRRAYRFSNLRYEDGETLYRRLCQVIDEGELYRQEGFSMDDVVALLKTNSLYISQVINYFAKTSFPNFLHARRLSYLRIRLQDDPNADISIAWKEAGFGSYSSFNRYLKQHLQLSPAAYARSVREISA